MNLNENRKYQILTYAQYHEGPKSYEDFKNSSAWEIGKKFDEPDLTILDNLINEGFLKILEKDDIQFINSANKDVNTKIKIPWRLKAGHLDYTPKGFEALSKQLALTSSFYNYTNINYQNTFPFGELYVKSEYLVWPCLLNFSGIGSLIAFHILGEVTSKPEFDFKNLLIESGIKMNIAHYSQGIVGCRVTIKN